VLCCTCCAVLISYRALACRRCVRLTVQTTSPLLLTVMCVVAAGELKTHLGTSKGSKELSQAANTLFNSVALGKETEQSTCRIRACANDADDADALAGSCSNIFTAIKTLQQSATYSSKQCSSFGFGPGVKACKANSTTTTTDNTGTDGASSISCSITVQLIAVAALTVAAAFTL
jgi:hypothetical protein